MDSSPESQMVARAQDKSKKKREVRKWKTGGIWVKKLRASVMRQRSRLTTGKQDVPANRSAKRKRNHGHFTGPGLDWRPKTVRDRLHEITVYVGWGEKRCAAVKEMATRHYCALIGRMVGLRQRVPMRFDGIPVSDGDFESNYNCSQRKS
ncbi:hypothetical protein BU24DRAFT_124735 [Aaosphaeria arxii CBS 175.79]|uniref:Uncharacterized protein n=1 Tax=Aaosphaeria arxii CBS 175.79 TaxID=1450172 RepID=A0A6A5Y552_9PLEO|nr:uncharacterized protein BU24DRAFT_124735 [Aaosphaeria arxii CBS 175.79]KAF2019664.1 hypothetical protein BU24DRAFT_124735 [Aaosphaeria arxii CBS 175.79]